MRNDLVLNFGSEEDGPLNLCTESNSSTKALCVARLSLDFHKNCLHARTEQTTMTTPVAFMLAQYACNM